MCFSVHNHYRREIKPCVCVCDITETSRGMHVAQRRVVVYEVKTSGSNRRQTVGRISNASGLVWERSVARPKRNPTGKS